MGSQGVQRPTEMITHGTVVPKPSHVLGLHVLKHSALVSGGVVTHGANIAVAFGAYRNIAPGLINQV